MVTRSAVLFGLMFYMLKAVPGLIQSLGYVFGMLFSSWVFDRCMERDLRHHDG